MKLRRKYAILIASIAIASLVFGTIAMAVDDGDTSPFQALWEAIFGIQDDVEDLQYQMDLQAQIAVLQAKVQYLEGRLNILELVPGPQGPPGEQGPQGPQGPSGGFGAPDYDSGWVAIMAGGAIVLEHNLGTTQVLVYLIGCHHADPDLYHQYYYGVDVYRLADGTYVSQGASWRNLDDTHISVQRGYGDVAWQEFRLRMWIIP